MKKTFFFLFFLVVALSLVSCKQNSLENRTLVAFDSSVGSSSVNTKYNVAFDEKQNIVLSVSYFNSGDYTEEGPTVVAEDTLSDTMLLLQKYKIHKSLRYAPKEPAGGSTVRSYTFYFEDETSISICLEDGWGVIVPRKILNFEDELGELITMLD